MNRSYSAGRIDRVGQRGFLIAVLVVSVSSACVASPPEVRDGVIMAHGDTVVEMAAYQPGAASTDPRRAATFSDAVEVTADIACTHPEGISDLERRAAISREMDSRKIDQASFDAELRRAMDGMAFMEALAETMEKKCPAALSKLLEGAEKSQPDMPAPSPPHDK